MKKILSILGTAIIHTLSIIIIAVTGGTILWAFWDNCIPAVFPGLVKNGMIAVDLAWWEAVTLTWIFAILFKDTNSN